ncbi:hypothetical protein CCACVL1_18199 [Corchorus capsularis]|uniref:Uncharacterized protein n=1 Tax=Corchorus capsularis TaxID=210143 RepID=A0A1R3HMC3_COCAP|nr:hypothetical protein CCACVL1_18199 [Corchorus capsularis]
MGQGMAAIAGQSSPDVAGSCPNLRACRSGKECTRSREIRRGGGRNVSNFDEIITTLKIFVLHAGWLENHELTMDSLLYPMEPKFLRNQGYAKKLNKKDGWEVDGAFCSP